MKVVLADDVSGLGDIGQTVNVKPGYARNFLIPRGFALECDTSNARALEHRMRQIEAKKKKLKGVAESKSAELAKVSLTLEVRVGENGKVFGSVSTKDIALKLTELGYELDRRKVILTEPLRKLGEHTVAVRLHQEVETKIKVTVIGKESSKEETEKDVENARQDLASATTES